MACGGAGDCPGGTCLAFVCEENADCTGGGACAALNAACTPTQATIPQFYGAQSAVPPPPNQFIRPPYLVVNVKIARANCVVAVDGSETCDAKTEWDDPTLGESDYHAADKYYLSSTAVGNAPGESPMTMRFCGENIEAMASTSPLAGSNWANHYAATSALAACTKTELRLCGGYNIDSAPGANDAHSPVDSRNDGDAQKATLVTACANNIQSTRSGFRLNRATGRYVQTVTLKNNGQAPVIGPVAYLLFNLSVNATLFNSTGTTSAIVPAGTPYVTVDIGVGNTLNSGDTATITLQFTNPTNQGITYDSRVRSGAGDL